MADKLPSDERRRERYLWRAALAEISYRLVDEGQCEWSDLPWRRTATCGEALGDVGVAWSTSHDACYPAKGIASCGSVWACSVCTGKIRALRVAETSVVAVRHAEEGGSLLLVTLTPRHRAGDSLGPMVRGISEAWRVLQRDRFWREYVRPYLVGSMRALEVTHGFTAESDGNGWHPHLHLLLLVDGQASLPRVLARVRRFVESRWSNAVVDQLGPGAEPGLRGVDVREIAAGDASYIAKISQEVARGDLKGAARQPRNLVDIGRLDLWGEYCSAMRGMRAVQWSRGLRGAFGLQAPENDEAALLLDLEDGLLVRWVEHRTFNRLHWMGRVPHLLESLEAQCRAVRDVAS